MKEILIYSLIMLKYYKTKLFHYIVKTSKLFMIV